MKFAMARASGLILLAVAACSQPQLVDENVARSLNVVSVDVDVSKASSSSVRGFTFSDARAEAIFDDAIAKEFTASTPDGRQVVVDVDIERLYVPNPALGMIAGSNYGYAGAMVRINDARTGQQVAEPFEVYVGGANAAGGQFRPGLVGVAMQQSEMKEFQLVSSAFAQSLHDSIYGEKPSSNSASAAAAVEKPDTPGVTETMEEYNARMKCRNSIKKCS